MMMSHTSKLGGEGTKFRYKFRMHISIYRNTRPKFRSKFRMHISIYRNTLGGANFVSFYDDIILKIRDRFAHPHHMMMMFIFREYEVHIRGI